jgi:transposase
MISLEEYAMIRQCKKNKMSQRKTAELLGISRRTVKRYWVGAHTPDEKKDYPAQVDSKLKQNVMTALAEYFAENQTVGKQRVNAKTAWLAIRETYCVGESTVRRYVRELKGLNPDGFIPLSFEPGEVMQVDWCEVKVVISGNIWKVPLFCAVLPYSYTIFAMVMPNMQMPCFTEAHTEAFAFFGGVAQRVFYDNLRTAVLAGHGKRAIKQESFKMLEAHYAFEAVFMNKESGNEKGAVENLCSLVRQVALTPMPRGESLGEIQGHITQKLVDYIRFHKIRDRPRSVAAMNSEERPCLMPLPMKPYHAYDEQEAVVRSDLTFYFDATKFSVPQEYIGKKITVRASSYRTQAWHQGKLVVAHKRPFIKGEHQYIPEHYLALLEKKPRAVQNAAPLKYGQLPTELERFRKLCRDKNKLSQLVEILLLGRLVDADVLLPAVDWANRTGSPTIDSVRLYLKSREVMVTCQDEQPGGGDMPVVDKPEFSGYDALIPEEGDTTDE